jgi:D-alanine--poly(phosphoribitol) ligase subunit 1
MFNNLRERMLKSGNNLALIVKGVKFSYRQVVDMSDALSHKLIRFGCANNNRVAILGNRNYFDYISILAVIFAKCVYVPINPRINIERIIFILKKSEAKILLIDNSVLSIYESLIENGLENTKIQFVINSESGECIWQGATSVSTDFKDGVYIMFTSGTTGEPKGVPINKNQLNSYFSSILKEYPIYSKDIVVNTCELSFDLSVHEIFIAFLSGAALLVIDNSSSLLAHRYVQKYGATIWSSVPSVVSFASKAKQMKIDSMPTIRLAFFCGEALTRQTVDVIFSASSNCDFVVNLWGPTEATIAFTHYKLNRFDNYSDYDVIPIGDVLDGQKIMIVDPLTNLEVFNDNTSGELLQTGSQVITEYWLAPELSVGRFIEKNNLIWYKSGDLTKYVNKSYHYLGRIDRQIKFKGYRLELQDIESCVRKCLNEKLVCIVPKYNGLEITNLVAFIASEKIYDSSVALEIINKNIPSYIQISEINFIEDMPLNLNGKIDYSILTQMIN